MTAGPGSIRPSSRYRLVGKGLALTLRFLLELAALAALVYAGVTVVSGLGGWLVGLALAGVAGLAWGLFVAPRASITAPVPVRLAVEVAVFASACLGLFTAGRPALATLLGGLYLVDRLVLWGFGGPLFEPHPGGPAR